MDADNRVVKARGRGAGWRWTKWERGEWGVSVVVSAMKKEKKRKNLSIHKNSKSSHDSFSPFPPTAQHDRSANLGRHGQKDKTAPTLSSWPRDWVSPWERHFSSSQFQVPEAKSLGITAKRVKAPFQYLAFTHEVKALSQAQQAENTGTPVDLIEGYPIPATHIHTSEVSL